MTSRVLRFLPTAYLYALDLAVAVVVVMVYLAFAEISTGPAPLWLGYLLALLVGAPLAGRRSKPLLTLGIVLMAQNVATVAHITLEPYTATAFAMYVVASTCSRRVAVGALAGSLGSAWLAVFIAEPWPDDAGLALFVALVVGAAWALGRTTRIRRSYEARQAAEAAAKAIADERMRIARELHDVVAHSLSLITVKAGVAAHVASSQPEQAQEALRVIESASRGTLVEMRRLLGVLRSEDAAAELAPMPGMDDLPELVSRASLAGVPVSLSVSGSLPEGLGTTVYRIVQESVTNVVKHAAPASCTVSIVVEDASVMISVIDDGPGERVLAGGGGHGLIGMRERVAVYGGTFWAGPLAGGGFAVRAEVPLT
ncbi:two-component sensor histidine kinase [Saccharothrix sp. ALI-22-I]|uniref:sensor histidine kinase n=1 Tax=Saccharothrix sp. ALI-22-I TaxID=1933778 RepID=UPI00097BE328|nr:histidine kinase [Saccharothrix sp. ALI-22-I]ONI85187.1 two-component sensor histidine kinase [Saccharothrix sp. ALI-22-I]